jgi:hypothetical protein
MNLPPPDDPGPRDLGLLVPSLRRPGNIARLWKSMQETCTADTTLLVGLDDDDATIEGYPPGPGYVVSGGLRYVTAWVNHLAVSTLGQFAALGHVGDDNTCDTPGWDAEILKALGKTPFAFANDLYPRAPGSLCCHVFMRSDVVRTLGYFGPPEIAHMYVDVAWMAWGLACGITYLHDVLLPHHHYTIGAANDATYAASAALMPPDLANWHRYARREGPGGLNDDIAKLGGEPYTPESLAAFNRDLNVPEVWPW